jgi:uncharacterized membrane protein
MRSLRIALIGSVLLNLFLVGALIAGAVWLRSGPRMIMAGSLKIAGSELPFAERRPFHEALRDARRVMRPTIEESRAAKAQAAALLRQPEPDQRAILAALERVRAADGAVRAVVEQRAVAYAVSLPPAARVKLADAMMHRADGAHSSSE